MTLPGGVPGVAVRPPIPRIGRAAIHENSGAESKRHCAGTIRADEIPLNKIPGRGADNYASAPVGPASNDVPSRDGVAANDVVTVAQIDPNRIAK